VYLPTAVGLCRLTNKNTAEPIDASIMDSAAFFFAQPHGWVRWDVGFKLQTALIRIFVGVNGRFARAS